MKIKPLVTAVRMGVLKMQGYPMSFNIVFMNSKGVRTVEKYPIYEKR